MQGIAMFQWLFFSFPSVSVVVVGYWSQLYFILKGHEYGTELQ
jgi:hypothetical protein